MVVVSSSEVTVRNNICDLTSGSVGRYCVDVRRDGGGTGSPAPIPNQIRIYNNTAYSGDANSEFAGVLLEVGVTNITIENNLSYAPSATAYAMIDSAGCGASCFSASNNSTNSQIKSTFPGWVSATPSTPADFSLAAGSYAREAGLATVPVFSDFFRTSRPQNGVMDIGAVEGP
jgi:hypothetical protein